MSISSINSQSGFQIPVSTGGRGEGKLPENAAATRLQGADTGVTTTAINKRATILGAQKADSSRSEKQADQSQEPDRKTLTEAVEKIERFVQSATSDVSFSVDEESGIRVVKVVDKESKEVIRQMPSKEVLELAKALDKLQGLMIKQTA